MERKTSLVIGPRTRQDILKGKNIRKLKDGGDNFEDYWTDSDGESSTVSKSSTSAPELTAEQSIVQSSNFFNTSHVIETCYSPLKAKAVYSPLKTETIHSPLKIKAIQSPFKSKSVLPGDTEIADKIVKVNKETYTDFEDITVNLGVNEDNDNPESEVLNRILDSFARNNIPKVPSAEIQEIHSANNASPSHTAEFEEFHNITNSSQSHTHNKKSEIRVSRISLKGSKKSLSKSIKKDSKKKLQYDKFDKKMMQMVHRNNDKSEGISNSSEEDMPLMEQKSPFMEKKKTKSKVEKQIMEIATNIEDKENFSDDESLNENIKRNIKSLNQSINDSESLSFENTPVKKTDITSEHKNKNQKISLQDNYFPRSNCTEKKASTTGNSQIKEKSSETFISKNKVIADISHTADISVNSDEDSSYSELDNDTGKTGHSNCTEKKTSTTANSQIKEKSSETFISRKKVIANSSHTADISVNSDEDSSYSELDNDTGETQTDEQVPVNKDSLPHNYLNMQLNSGNTNDVIDSETDSPSQHLSKNVMHQILPSSCDSNSAVEMSKLHKIDAFSRSSDSVEITASNDDISKNTSEDVSNMNDSNTSEVCMIAKEETMKNNNNDSIPDENNFDATDFNESSHFRTIKRRKTFVSSIPERNNVANRLMSFSEDSINVSETIMEKPAKKQKKNDNDKKRIKETRKNHLIVYEDIDETTNLDSSSQSQTPKKRRTRNCSTAEENDFANMQLNSYTNSVNNISEVNHKRTYKKQKKIASNKSRQKSPTNKSDFMSCKDIAEEDYLSFSHSHNSNSHNNSTKIKKTAKKQRKNKNDESNEVQKKADTSEQQINRRETSVNTRNSFISEENDHAVPSMNSSKSCSVKKDSIINKKKATKRQGKVESDKNRPLRDEHDNEDKNQYKAQLSKKSKSNLSKNNINKENEKSNYGGLRRSTRERYAPLARWRNERLIYSFKDGKIETLGIDKGTKEDANFLQSLYKKVNKKQKEKKPKRIEILDVIKGKKSKINPQKKFSLISWGSPTRCNTNENPSHAFLIKRMLETDKNSFGYIHIDVGKTKPPQYMPDEDLILIAVEGKVEICIYDEVFTLDRKDMFSVPRGSAYSIKNIANRRALLSFVVGDFKFFDCI